MRSWLMYEICAFQLSPSPAAAPRLLPSPPHAGERERVRGRLAKLSAIEMSTNSGHEPHSLVK